jgi:hypothetical protein
MMHTNVPEEAEKFIALFELWLDEPKQRPIVGLNLKYTHKKYWAALMQLCMCDHCLLWHQSLAKRYFRKLITFLQRPDISFASVDKRQDVSKHEAMSVRVPNHVDIQDHFYIKGTSGHISTGALAAEIIDPSYADMKTKFDKAQHNKWGRGI